MSSLSKQAISDVNTISRFLSCPDIASLTTCPPVDVLVFCASAVLAIADNVFSALETRPELARTLVLCGGVGHSTQLLYEAIRQNAKYGPPLAHRVEGLPEAGVLELILREFYPTLWARVDGSVFRILVEDRSTNCGANAVETRRLLERHSVPLPRSMLVVQDPTMSLRTLASFRQAYVDVSPNPVFLGCPTLVPIMALDRPTSGHGGAQPRFDVPGVQQSELWNTQRFFDLIMGEVPRLRDDEHGYGPNGKGFIAHVDVPAAVEAAWARLRETLDSNR